MHDGHPCHAGQVLDHIIAMPWLSPALFDHAALKADREVGIQPASPHQIQRVPGPVHRAEAGFTVPHWLVGYARLGLASMDADISAGKGQLERLRDRCELYWVT